MFSILLKEFYSFLNSLIAYVVIGIFLTGVGLFLWIYPSTNVLDYGYADMSTFFNITPLIFLFLVPAITMRSFAEEKKQGTLELIFTKPLTDYSIIIGKFLAAWLLVLFALLPTLFYYYTLYTLGAPKGNLDSAAIFGSYIGLLLLGGVFAAIGIFCSSLAENQIISFIFAVFFCFFFYQGIQFISEIDVWSTASSYISALSIQYHYNALSKGLVDSRNVVYLLSFMAAMIMATRYHLKASRFS